MTGDRQDKGAGACWLLRRKADMLAGGTVQRICVTKAGMGS